MGNRQTPNLFLENRQSENFCLTYFSKPNRDPIEKKFHRFEDPHCNRGGGQKGHLEFPRIRHDLSLGFDVFWKFSKVLRCSFFAPGVVGKLFDIIR